MAGYIFQIIGLAILAGIIVIGVQLTRGKKKKK